VTYLSGPEHILIRGGDPRRWGRGIAWLLIVLVVLLAGPGNASEWRPVLTTPDGIEIFNRDATAAGLIEFRGVGVIQAPLPVVASVIFDTDRRKEWIKGLEGSRILRWEGADAFIEYDHIDMPIFFSDREFVSKVRMRSDPSRREVVFQFQPADDPSAPNTGYLRGEMLNMTFLLTSIDQDRSTRVDAEVLCDPKGWIPKWLVNFFLRDWPKTTFRNLRKEVLKPGIPVDPRFSVLPGPGTSGSEDPSGPDAHR
jgi:hypothetical protein